MVVPGEDLEQGRLGIFAVPVLLVGEGPVRGVLPAGEAPQVGLGELPHLLVFDRAHGPGGDDLAALEVDGHVQRVQVHLSLGGAGHAPLTMTLPLRISEQMCSVKENNALFRRRTREFIAASADNPVFISNSGCQQGGRFCSFGIFFPFPDLQSVARWPTCGAEGAMVGGDEADPGQGGLICSFCYHRQKLSILVWQVR